MLRIKWIGCIVFFAMNTLWAEKPDMSMSSPYQSVYQFLYFQQIDSYDIEKSAQTLKFTGSNEDRQELARQLKLILDGGGYYVVLGRLPREAGYVDTLSGREVYFLFHERLPEVYLEKYDDQWLFSIETVNSIPALYKRYFPLGVSRLANQLPAPLQKTYLDVALWKYLAVPALIIVGFLAYYIFYFLLFLVIRIVGNKYVRHLRGELKLKKKLATFISIYFAIGIVITLLPGIMLPVLLVNFLIPFLMIIRVVVLIVVILRVADVFFLYARDYVEKTPSKMDDQLLPIFIKMVQFVIIIGGAINIMKALEVNVTAVVAGVSIGGLAVALAAQDTVKNFIGSAMIFLDKPFQIGDYVIGGGYEGTVEEVGFRTTRLRNADRSVISVPNGNVANDTINNLGLRPSRRMQLTIGLMYSTPPDKIDKYLKALRTMVDVHPKASSDDHMIRFHNLGASSLDIFFRAYLFAPTLVDELEIREEIIFGIVRAAEQVGVSFAFPSTSVYMEQTTPPEEDTRDVQTLNESVSAFMHQYENRLKEKYNTIPPDSGA